MTVNLKRESIVRVWKDSICGLKRNRNKKEDNLRGELEDKVEQLRHAFCAFMTLKEHLMQKAKKKNLTAEASAGGHCQQTVESTEIRRQAKCLTRKKTAL